ncbi:hypothetical protein pipiens_002395 [Culex pipiens pipiens]|uniref:Uncharacterized protein n=1 Tax=Culex pipiens pipiens TaxID=38569 RepID=A0ABD1DH55_CULPP
MPISKFFYKYHELQLAAFSAPSIQTFHRLLQMNLNHSTYGYLPLIHNEWEILVPDLDLLPAAVKLPERESSSMAKVQLDFEINQKIAQDHHCRDEVGRICGYLCEGSEISDCVKDQLESQLYQKLLGTKGKGYFGNIFAIDAKVQAIGQVFKQRKVENFEVKVKDLREKDVTELEEIFKGIQRSILRVLERHTCDTIDNMIVNMGNLPTEVILAIEYWMLELCEILITTKQFQDNYHTIKQDIQMICGRNFRNYLAHDSISYDLLTNSSRTKVLVNALVMAKKDWKIFGAPQKKDLPKLKDVKTDELENTLLVCSKFGRSRMIRLLLERFPTLLTAIDKALKAASEFRRWKTALLLLERGANPWWKDGSKERSPAELAVGYNCLGILRHFLKSVPENTSGILTLAAAKGSIRMMKALLDAGLDICQDRRVFFDTFEHLTSRGADLSILDHQNNSALFTLLQQTMPWPVLHQIFNHTVQTNPNLLKLKSLDGTTLLSQAASMCKLEAVRFLLDHGADQTIQARDGSFPLYNAVMVRSVPIVKALLSQNPSTVVNIQRSDTWETALFAAAGLNNAELVQLFLDSGADCTLRDIEGFTVVAKAIVNGCRDSLKVLLEHGKRSGIDVVNSVAPGNLSALHIGLVKDNVDTFRTVLEFLVGGTIEDGLSSKSLTKLKKILQLNDYLMGFTILTAATLSESHKIVAYLNQVISVYNRLTNEDLNVGGVPILPGFSQDMFLSGGNVGNVDETFSGGVLDPAFMTNISELENMSRDLEQMLQSMNMLD